MASCSPWKHLLYGICISMLLWISTTEAASSGASYKDVVVPFVLTVVILVTLLSFVGMFLCRVRRRHTCLCCGKQCLCVTCHCHDDDIDTICKDSKVKVVTSDRVSSRPWKDVPVGLNQGVMDGNDKCSKCHIRELTVADLKMAPALPAKLPPPPDQMVSVDSSPVVLAEE